MRENGKSRREKKERKQSRETNEVWAVMAVCGTRNACKRELSAEGDGMGEG